MTAEFVPAVDLAGHELWADARGNAHNMVPDAFASTGTPEGWRRLGYLQPVQTPGLPEQPDLKDSGGDIWCFANDGLYYLNGDAKGFGWSRDEVASLYGPVGEVTP